MVVKQLLHHAYKANTISTNPKAAIPKAQTLDSSAFVNTLKHQRNNNTYKIIITWDHHEL